MSHHVASIFIFIGALFSMIACIGLWKLKGLYMKMHAATKVGTLAAGLMLIGVGVLIKNAHTITEIVLLIFFIAVTNPLAAHLIAKVYYRLNHS